MCLEYNRLFCVAIATSPVDLIQLPDKGDRKMAGHLAEHGNGVGGICGSGWADKGQHQAAARAYFSEYSFIFHNDASG